MLTLRTSSPFSLVDRLEQQISEQLQSIERVPAAAIHETAEAYELVLELHGADRQAIDVKATDRTLVISTERRKPRTAAPDASPEGTAPETSARPAAPQLTEFRDGLLHVSAPKTRKLSTVTVQVEG
jgi:HSP20 family protein